MKFKIFLLPAVIQIIAWVFFYFFYGGDDWYQDKLKEIIFATLVAFMTYFLGTFSLFFKPVFITVIQHNLINSSMKETIIDIQQNQCKTLQNQRTISLQVILERRGSIWWRIFNNILKNHDIYLSVSLKPAKLSVIQQDISLPGIRTNGLQGFDLHLNSNFTTLFQTNSDYSIEETYNFYISYQDGVHEVTNALYIIDPLIIIEPSPNVRMIRMKTLCLNWLLKRQIEFHKILISKR